MRVVARALGEGLAAHRERGDRLEDLSAVDLTYHFPGSENGIGGVNLQIERGTLTVITGRIGSGKTTLLRALLGLLPLEAGEIRWNDELIAKQQSDKDHEAKVQAKLRDMAEKELAKI